MADLGYGGGVRDLYIMYYKKKSKYDSVQK